MTWQHRAALWIAAVVIAFIAGNQCARVPVEYITTVERDTVWMERSEPLQRVELPQPEIRVGMIYDTLTYVDTVTVSNTIQIPYFISSLGPVTDFRLGAIQRIPTITERITRIEQPRGFYVGGTAAQFPGVGAAYLTGDWLFSYEYRFQQGHAVGVKYRLFK